MGGICRDIHFLEPDLIKKCEAFLAECEKQKIPVLITETYRSALVQTAYYAQGRKSLKDVNTMRIGAGLVLISEKENTIITNTIAGKSKHNLRKAFDCVPLVNGKPCWNNSALFKKMGAIGKSVGLKWGGDWKSIKDSPHFEI